MDTKDNIIADLEYKNSNLERKLRDIESEADSEKRKLKRKISDLESEIASLKRKPLFSK
jgi:predicted  nucleic acid-binding Zn-ribbon protein